MPDPNINITKLEFCAVIPYEINDRAGVKKMVGHKVVVIHNIETPGTHETLIYVEADVPKEGHILRFVTDGVAFWHHVQSLSRFFNVIGAPWDKSEFRDRMSVAIGERIGSLS